MSNVLKMMVKKTLKDMEYSRVINSPNALLQIRNVNIELCSHCNLKCVYCALDKDNKRQSFMDLGTFKKFLAEMEENEMGINLNLSHSGEALLHPKFKEFVSALIPYIDNLGDIGLNTNLMLMDRAMTDFILDSNVFSNITCSIDGKSPAWLETLRKGVKAETVLDNFGYLIKKNNERRCPIIITVNNGNDTNSDLIEWDKDFLHTLNMAHEVVHYTFHNWTGNIAVPFHEEKINNGYCQFAFNTLVIFTDGSVGKCCSDLNAETVYGNIKQKSLKEIVNSAERKSYLMFMHNGKRKQIKGCERCNRD